MSVLMGFFEAKVTTAIVNESDANGRCRFSQPLISGHTYPFISPRRYGQAAGFQTVLELMLAEENEEIVFHGDKSTH